ncbi:MAG TPA: DNA polymerase III subunit gamma/tau, partial [Marmoricola sp.]|nr:DNA polymerase III subunit gamma/tau [Marmoricola sp.]
SERSERVEGPAPSAQAVVEPIPAPIPVVEERAPASVSKPPEPEPEPAPAPAATSTSGLGLADVRRIWPDLLERIKTMRRFTWMLLSQNAQVVGVEGNVLTLGFKNAGARESFAGGGSDEILRQALIDMVGADWKVEAIIDPSAQPGSTPPPRVTKPAVEPQQEAAPGPTAAAPDSPPDWAAPGESQQRRPASPEIVAKAREGITPTRSGSEQEPTAPQNDPDADADRDDADADDSGLQGAELLQRELGATVIEEIPHE